MFTRPGKPSFSHGFPMVFPLKPPFYQAGYTPWLRRSPSRRMEDGRAVDHRQRRHRERRGQRLLPLLRGLFWRRWGPERGWPQNLGMDSIALSMLTYIYIHIYIYTYIFCFIIIYLYYIYISQHWSSEGCGHCFELKFVQNHAGHMYIYIYVLVAYVICT